jgi:AraC-like DNA-binding protein
VTRPGRAERQGCAGEPRHGRIGEVDHDSGPIAESAWRQPALALRPFVAWYVGYHQAGLEAGRHRGLPSPYLTVIITFDEPLTIAIHPDSRQSPGHYDTLVAGLHTSPAMIVHPGRQAGIQLGLHPLGARALLGMPAGELANSDVDGTDVLGSAARELRERVWAAASWPERFAAVDDVLLSRACFERTVPAEVAHAWQRLLSSGGAVAVSDLAAEVGWSSRHLTERFRTETGLGPKAAARVVRFDAARRCLQRRIVGNQRAALADLAVAFGYYDQAHFAREFGDFAGCPPSAWVVEEFRNVQGSPDLPVAGSAP